MPTQTTPPPTRVAGSVVVWEGPATWVARAGAGRRDPDGWTASEVLPWDLPAGWAADGLLGVARGQWAQMKARSELHRTLLLDGPALASLGLPQPKHGRDLPPGQGFRDHPAVTALEVIPDRKVSCSLGSDQHPTREGHARGSGDHHRPTAMAGDRGPVPVATAGGRRRDGRSCPVALGTADPGSMDRVTGHGRHTPRGQLPQVEQGRAAAEVEPPHGQRIDRALLGRRLRVTDPAGQLASARTEGPDGHPLRQAARVPRGMDERRGSSRCAAGPWAHRFRPAARRVVAGQARAMVADDDARPGGPLGGRAGPEHRMGRRADRTGAQPRPNPAKDEPGGLRRVWVTTPRLSYCTSSTERVSTVDSRCATPTSRKPPVPQGSRGEPQHRMAHGRTRGDLGPSWAGLGMPAAKRGQRR